MQAFQEVYQGFEDTIELFLLDQDLCVFGHLFPCFFDVEDDFCASNNIIPSAPVVMVYYQGNPVPFQVETTYFYLLLERFDVAEMS